MAEVMVVLEDWLVVDVELLDELVEVGPTKERLTDPACHVEMTTVAVGLAVSMFPFSSSHTVWFSAQQSTSNVVQQ